METLALLFKEQNLKQLFEQYVLPWGVNILLALLVLVVGRWIVKRIVVVVRRMMAHAEYDQMLINGLALQGSLQNFAAGIMILIFRPFRVGDYIEAGGSAGTVERVGLFSTIMTSVDNKEVILPNGNIYRDTITNYSARDTRRVDLVVSIGYNSDIKKAKELLHSIVTNEPRVLENPSTYIAVSELADSSINLVVRPWVNTPDYFPVKCELTEAIKLAFDQAGIEIPFPQLDVHLSKSS